MATLTFERGATGGQAGGLSMMDLSINDVMERAAGETQWATAIQDPHVRAELVDLITESRSNGLMATRLAANPALASDWPSSVSMSGKLRY